ncbi:FitA-like ribbon-helix-helix domain-containing protein [Acaryochloris sp. CCMEE 5410]|uniref:FitA-like ribbon-helix-helix domain-containing protein n=1 Tax=Acaryochloris sp. CCMEE 5410 TaxID=310037 RepID=UPI00024846DC|nr:Arc family DNA-binding protein [Acaryochloris sp. CCMEE 5410]KAI9130977.1 Arc family DNA-binding protein [Acaryochloris sp. CCMEE 5410]
MANLTLKNIPDDLYELLKETANRNHRSINSELIACLEQMLLPNRLAPDQILANARAVRARVKTKKISAKDIADAKMMGRPE